MKKKRFSEEQIVRILREVERGEKTVAEACKNHGVSEQSYYRWRKKFGEMDVADVKRLRELEKENAQLKKLLANSMLEVDAMRKVINRNF